MSPNKEKEVTKLINHLFREEYGKVVSYLTSKFGFHFLETAQDITQDTLVEAYKTWSFNGQPENPQAWIFTVAKNKSINWIKREQSKYAVYQRFKSDDALVEAPEGLFLNDEIQDSMLKMIFACCQPEIPFENQIALILNILCGFSRKEISSAFLIKEETVKKRLFRARKQIREQQLISPDIEEMTSDQEGRIEAVCTALYLMFNEGYNSSHDDDLIRKDLCLESIRLLKLMIDKFQQNTRLHALLSTMNFHIARFEARLDNKGAIVLLQDQDRGLWNREFIKMGLYHLSQASNGDSISPYHLEASIAAQHCLAKDFESTNWKLISRFYTKLYLIKPSPIIQLNLAIISGILDGPDEAIAQLNELKNASKELENYHLLYAALGHFHLKKKEKDLAIDYFEKAKFLTSSQKEIDLLNQKIKLATG